MLCHDIYVNHFFKSRFFCSLVCNMHISGINFDAIVMFDEVK